MSSEVNDLLRKIVELLKEISKKLDPEPAKKYKNGIVERQARSGLWTVFDVDGEVLGEFTSEAEARDFLLRRSINPGASYINKVEAGLLFGNVGKLPFCIIRTADRIGWYGIYDAYGNLMFECPSEEIAKAFVKLSGQL